MTSTALAAHTTLHVGGPATHLAVAEDVTALRAALGALTVEQRRRLVVLGEGSNVVVADRGLAAPVVVFRGPAATLRPDADGVVTVPGSMSWDALVDRAVACGLAGIESMTGIPGTVGGAVVQNIGAYGAELSEVLLRTRVLEVATLDERELDAADCAFGYRTSRFKAAERGRWVVLDATLRLRPGGRHTPRYADLADALRRDGADVDAGVPLAVARDTVRAIRAGKGMLYDPERPETWTAGSFFTNPVVGAGVVERVADAAGVDVTAVPRWPVGDAGRVKLSAAWLIERAGFGRGLTRGDVRLSPLHALALSNHTGRGTAAALIGLAREVADGVRDRFGVRLVPEPILLGFTADELGPLAVDPDG